MRYAPFLVLISAGGLFGWFAPDLLSKADGPVPSAAQPARLDMAQAVEPASPAPVVLPREADGHFYADVIVGESASTMLIDTGATVIALTGHDAAAMGLQWDQSQVQPVARGASGLVHGVPVTLDSVRVGDIEAKGVEAIIVPDGLGISLLGQSFLSRAGTVQIESGRMILGS